VPKAGLGRWYALAALVIVLDQLSKWALLATLNYGDTVTVTPFFNWVFVFNRGAAFSFLANEPGWQRWFFMVLALGVSAWVAWTLPKQPEEKLLNFSLTLIMGGALGNVIDRLRFGAVVDFIQVHWADWYYPAFNVADCAITVGAVLLAWDQIRRKPVQGNSDSSSS